MSKIVQSIVWIGLGVCIGLLLFVSQPNQPTVHALPEYASRTGQQCTTCHVNPAGGGPRTLRGLIWIAEGRPDEVPPLPGGEAKEDEAALDGARLYEKFECSRCHGLVGQGDIGPILNQTEWPAGQLADIIRNGTGAMKGFPPQVMAEEEMDALIPYVQAIGRGEIESGLFLQKRLLPPAQLACGSNSATSPPRTDCGGN